MRRSRTCVAILTLLSGLLLTSATAQAANSQAYEGSIQVQRTYQAYFTNGGTLDSADPETVTLTDPVFALAPAGTSGFTLQSGSVSYNRAPLTETISALGLTCTVTWSQDTSQQPTATLTLGGSGSILTLTVPIVATQSANCGGGTSKGKEFWNIPVIPLVLMKSGFFLTISADDITQNFPANDPIPPTTQQYSGELSLNSVSWVSLKRDVKQQALDRLKQQLDRALAYCDAKEMMLAAAPFARLFVQNFSPVECAGEARLTYRLALERVDPPDSNYQSVTLPAPAPAPPVWNRCTKTMTKSLKLCRSLVASERKSEAAVSELDNIDTAIVTTMNRASTAESAGDTASEQLQADALAVYDSWQQLIGHQVDSAARSLARILTRAHVVKQLSASELATLSMQLQAGNFPSAAAKALRSAGITAPAFRTALKSAAPGMKPGRFTVVSALDAPTTPSPAPAADLQLSPANLTELVSGLHTAGTLSSTQATTVANAITAYESATGSSASALSSLTAAVATLPATAQQFLDIAIKLMPVAAAG